MSGRKRYSTPSASPGKQTSLMTSTGRSASAPPQVNLQDLTSQDIASIEADSAPDRSVGAKATLALSSVTSFLGMKKENSVRGRKISKTNALTNSDELWNKFRRELKDNKVVTGMAVNRVLDTFISEEMADVEVPKPKAESVVKRMGKRMSMSAAMMMGTVTEESSSEPEATPSDHPIARTHSVPEYFSPLTSSFFSRESDSSKCSDRGGPMSITDAAAIVSATTQDLAEPGQDAELFSHLKPDIQSDAKPNIRMKITMMLLVFTVLGCSALATRYLMVAHEFGKSTGDDFDGRSSSRDQDSANKSPDGSFSTSGMVFFQPELQQFSSSILDGYGKCSSLIEDVEEAGKYLANIIILANVNPNNENKIIQEGSSRSATDSKPNQNIQTDCQVLEVDEADIVKSDGDNTFLAYGNELVWLNLQGEVVQRTKIHMIDFAAPDIGYWNPEYADAAVPSDLSSSTSDMPMQRIEGLLMEDEKLVVIVSFRSDSSKLRFVDGHMTAAYVYTISSGYLDLMDKTIFKGKYQRAHNIKNHMHIVTLAGINSYRLDEQLNQSNFRGLTDEEYVIAANDKATLILPQYARQVVSELIGSYHDGTIDEKSCENIVKISDMVDMDRDNDPTKGEGILHGFAQIVSFDTKFGLLESEMSGAFLPTYGLDVYINHEELYLAGKGYARKADNAWSDYTYIMGFQLRGSKAMPTIAGRVPGHLFNSFSIDYYNNHFRVATTLPEKSQLNEVTRDKKQIQQAQNQVIILQQHQEWLKETGRLFDLGIGKEIHSVQFFGDKGFFATGDEDESIHVMDLSDPKNPKQMGELEISGYSNFLHPIDDDHILTVSQDTDNETLLTRIALFNVMDLSNPFKIQNLAVKGWSSPGEKYHHNIRYLPISSNLIIPVSIFSENKYENFDGFHIYHIDKEKGITSVGKVTHADANSMSGCFGETYIPPRIMLFQDDLVTLKGHVVKLSDGLERPEEVWKVNLDADETEDSYNCLPWFSE